MAQDPRVTAMWNLAPRILGVGVPYGDFKDLLGSIERWDDWCAAWSARASIHETIGRDALAAGHGLSAGHHLTNAALCYHFAKFTFTNDMEQLRAAHQRAVACRTDALPHLSPPGERIEVPFEGKALAGNLRRPAGAERPPLVLIIGGMDSCKEEMHNAERFLLERGLATLAFDGPGQGEAEYDFPIRFDFEVPAAAMIDWAETRGDIDPDRIGLLGASLGGYYAARVAATESRVKAAICNAPAFSVFDNFDQRRPALKENYRVRAHCDTLDQVREKLRDFDLAPVAGDIVCPLFIIGCRDDTVTSYKDAVRLADEVAGTAELVVIDGAIHVAANRPYQHQTQAADWMAEKLGVTGGGSYM